MIEFVKLSQDEIIFAYFDFTTITSWSKMVDMEHNNKIISSTTRELISHQFCAAVQCSAHHIWVPHDVPASRSSDQRCLVMFKMFEFRNFKRCNGACGKKFFVSTTIYDLHKYHQRAEALLCLFFIFGVAVVIDVKRVIFFCPCWITNKNFIKILL